MHRHCRAAFAWTLLAVTAWGSRAVMSAPAVNSIPSEVKTALTMTEDYRGTIKAFVVAQTGALVDADDADGQKSARNLLGNECAAVGQPCSAAFLDEYATQFVAAMQPHLADTSLRVRLNIALVTEKVAANTNSSRLAPMIVSLLQDPADSVCLHAMKAAGKLLVSAVQVERPNSLLLKAIVPAVAVHSYHGDIVDEAYMALRSPDPGVVEEMINLFRHRVELYKTQIPDEPTADRSPSFYLTISENWNALPAGRQTETMQLMSDLASMAAQHLVAGAVTEDSDQGKQLIELIRQTAEAVATVGLNANIPSLQEKGQPAEVLRISANQTPQAILKAVTLMTDAIQAGFPGVKAPPTIAVPAPATAPASAPAGA